MKSKVYGLRKFLPDGCDNYGRDVRVELHTDSDFGCMVCKSKESTLVFESSDWEYVAIELCLSCIRVMFNGEDFNQ